MGDQHQGFCRKKGPARLRLFRRRSGLAGSSRRSPDQRALNLGCFQTVPCVDLRRWNLEQTSTFSAKQFATQDSYVRNAAPKARDPTI
jgi:hypothetical protein